MSSTKFLVELDTPPCITGESSCLQYVKRRAPAEVSVIASRTSVHFHAREPNTVTGLGQRKHLRWVQH